ncbi:ribonuclease P protein component 2 [Candidatus Bathyarchaeota archaeon]|nr:ribonuclease P protein component 2 [Candidatus Bathyarchaeota archaeon]
MPVRSTRRRYIVYQVLSEQELGRREILEAVKESVGMLFGELGMSRILITPIFYDETVREGILRCAHKNLWDLRAAIALVDQINSKKASILVKGVSGTIKAAKTKFLSGQPANC